MLILYHELSNKSSNELIFLMNNEIRITYINWIILTKDWIL